MLRLRPSLALRTAHGTDNQFLTKLLPVVGCLQSARNELRWLQEDCEKRLPQSERRAALHSHIHRRSRGEPLQYILGSTYFGDLEIKCRENVFIPRPETAAAVSYLAQCLVTQIGKRAKTNRRKRIQTARKPRDGKEDHLHLRGLMAQGQHLRVFDLCSGTGCIPLLFWHEYYRAASKAAKELPELEIVGFEMSEAALSLARENHASLMQQQSLHRTASDVAMRSLQQIDFVQANVLYRKNSPDNLRELPTIREAINQHIENTGEQASEKRILSNEIWISNPPYISPASYAKSTEKSVRDFEPKPALVPPLTSEVTNGTAPSSENDGDRFHEDILMQAAGMRTNVVLLEVEDMDQAVRVAKMAVQQGQWYTFEIWRDEPASNEPCQYVTVASKSEKHEVVRICGTGEGRSVLVCTRDGASLIGRHALTMEKIDWEALERYVATKPATRKFSKKSLGETQSPHLTLRKGGQARSLG